MIAPKGAPSTALPCFLKSLVAGKRFGNDIEAGGPTSLPCGAHSGVGDGTYPFCAVNEEKRAEVLHNFINITTFAGRNEPRLLKALKMNHLFFHIFN